MLFFAAHTVSGKTRCSRDPGWQLLRLVRAPIQQGAHCAWWCSVTVDDDRVPDLTPRPICTLWTQALWHLGCALLDTWPSKPCSVRIGAWGPDTKSEEA